jgi:hypothetical protein
MHRKAPHDANVRKSGKSLSRVVAVAAGVTAGSFFAAGAGQCATAPIQLVPQQLSQVATSGMPPKMLALLGKMPSNFHHFGVATAGKPAPAENLTLRFTAKTDVVDITTTPDFAILPGGTCRAGLYNAGSTCRLLMRFTPKGAGSRLGRATFKISAGKSVVFGLLGYSYFPVVSFTPSLVAAVPATISGKTGEISGARYIAVDDGDALYIADTGNGAVRYIDSSGVMTTLVSIADPLGLTVDAFGEVWFDVSDANTIYEIYDYGPMVTASGSGTDACGAGSSCSLDVEAVTSPSEMSTSDGTTIFFTDNHTGAAMSYVEEVPATLQRLYDPFAYQTNPASAFAVDSSENLYTNWANGLCAIVGQPLYEAENNVTDIIKVAGGRKCGFSGDGGKANGAEIGTSVGQIAFDLAGNMYFTDTTNNRVRRIDASTGIIRTIAGSGKTGAAGTTGTATSTILDTPTGLAVDSQGQVDILTQSAATGTAQFVLQVTTTGVLNFGSQAHGTASATMIVNVANTGNASLTFNRETINGADAGDFAIDPNTTNCNFASGNTLAGGQSCQIGVVFTPAATGTRVASLNLVDNTVNAVNKVKLAGTGS